MSAKISNSRIMIATSLLVAVGLFSAATVTLMSYSTAYAQSYGSSFKGNTTGAVVSEQGDKGKAGVNMSSSASYKSSYPKEKADDRRPFTVQSENHLYKPGDEVKIEGSIATSLMDQLGTGAITVKLNVTDNKGNVTAQKDAVADTDGQFSTNLTLPENAEQGSYKISAMIDISADLLGTLQADVKSKLETSARFEVVSSNAFAVNAEGKNFEVEIASNSTVSAFEFRQQEKKVTFHVEGQTGTEGVTEITIPKALLNGEIMVSIDGKVIPPESSDVVTIADTEEGMTLEINYHHSEHTVEVSGTNVVPEFPVSMVMMAAAIVSVIATVSLVSKRRGSVI